MYKIKTYVQDKNVYIKYVLDIKYVCHRSDEKFFLAMQII